MRLEKRIINNLWEQVLKSIGTIDQGLLRLVLEDNGTQEDLDAFLNGWDIEKAPIRCIILLANVMKTRPDLKFPGNIIPRLNGVLSYSRFKNLRSEVILDRLVKSFKDKGIHFKVAGDMAMRSLFPEKPWWVDNLEILVSESDLSSAIETANKIDNEEIIRISLIPVSESIINRFAPEDLTYYALVNIHDNLMEGQPLQGCLTTILAVKYLYSSKDNFDRSIVSEDAVLSENGFQIFLASKAIESVVPGLFTEDMTHHLSDRNLRKRLINFLFRRDVLAKKRKEGTSRIPIPSFIKYLTWLLVSKLGL